MIECALGLASMLSDEVDDDWIPCCMGSSVYGASRCTCWKPVFDVEQSPTIPGDFDVQRSMCGDCAYRPGSPERDEDGGWDQLQSLTYGSNPFWCHQGMRRVVEYRHPDGRVLQADPKDYQPLTEGNPPRMYQADGRPALICGGWALLKTKILEGSA